MATDFVTLRSWLRQAMPHPLLSTDLPGLGTRHQGKTCDGYVDQGRRTLIWTDRALVLGQPVGALPLRGQGRRWASSFWLDATRELVPNHLLSSPDPCAQVVVDCSPIPLDFSVSAYLTGVTPDSLWYRYATGVRELAGQRLPEGLKKNEALPAPVIAISPAGHEQAPALSPHEITARGLLTADELDALASAITDLFVLGQRHCERQGLLLVDARYRFGRSPEGKLLLLGELHTPDTARFWFEATYEIQLARHAEPRGFDKSFLNRYLASLGFQGSGPVPDLPDDIRVEAQALHLEALEAIVGQPFVPDLDDPDQRLRRNLGLVPAKG
ncbi:MAG: phosphoribosylaminoimidazolesuccinocarboxamide synthase [Polyangiaceae bacterium]|jgi:phosphoribosylaminoimidazole-succinocarboxamide synthase|nr:phosphoribosylaminoimidazolesuccinocarboxamide synthase [Polyangiaceae bacterium]